MEMNPALQGIMAFIEGIKEGLTSILKQLPSWLTYLFGGLTITALPIIFLKGLRKSFCKYIKHKLNIK